MYSYIQDGEKIKASNIYECDSISKENKCIKKYHSDWDWTSRVYPRSTPDLMRPLFQSDKNVKFRTDVDGFILQELYLTTIKNTSEVKQVINFDYTKKDNEYVSIVIPFDIVELNKKQFPANNLSNLWLVGTYKNTNEKLIKVVWYYGGSGRDTK